MDISLVPGVSTGHHLKLFYNATFYCNITGHREIGIDVTSKMEHSQSVICSPLTNLNLCVSFSTPQYEASLIKAQSSTNLWSFRQITSIDFLLGSWIWGRRNFYSLLAEAHTGEATLEAMVFLKKLETEPLYYSAILLLDIESKKNYITLQRYLHIYVHWWCFHMCINKRRYRYTVEYF